MATGNVTVMRDCTLHLDGMICGDLVVSPGARAVVRGIVNGGIRNEGDLELWGMVDGAINDISGRSVLKPGCVVQREVQG